MDNGTREMIERIELGGTDLDRAALDGLWDFMAQVDGEWGCCHGNEEIRAGLCQGIPEDDERAMAIIRALGAKL
jgi:hypothetical protein